MARRNANGEGTVYPRKDGRFEAAVSLPTASGTRKRIRVYGKTRKEAHDKLVAAKAQVQSGIPIVDRTWRLREYLDYWLQHGVSVKRAPLTYRRHEAVTRLYLKPELGKYTLHQLSVQTVQSFLDDLHACGKSAATITQVRKVLSAALTYAVRKELIFRNVARLVELPSYKPKKADHWTARETNQFLLAARPDPLYPAFVLLTLYGLRRGEVLGLRWCDIDFERGVLQVRQQVQRIDGKLRQVGLKTDSSERDEPLLETARLALKEHYQKHTGRATTDEELRTLRSREELIFTTKSGRPIESRNLYRSFLRICSQHGIRRITIHGIRHTNATTQKNLNVHDRDIQAILGHGDVRTTGIYEHVDMGSKRRALEKVEQQLFPQPTYARARCRQKLPSSLQYDARANALLHRCTSIISWWRLPDSNWGHKALQGYPDSLEKRLATVREFSRHRTRTWILGCVAVKITVKPDIIHQVQVN
jgi:integrase